MEFWELFLPTTTLVLFVQHAEFSYLHMKWGICVDIEAWRNALDLIEDAILLIGYENNDFFIEHANCSLCKIFSVKHGDALNSQTYENWNDFIEIFKACVRLDVRVHLQFLT